jgi:hypothetical protein
LNSKERRVIRHAWPEVTYTDESMRIVPQIDESTLRRAYQADPFVRPSIR